MLAIAVSAQPMGERAIAQSGPMRGAVFQLRFEGEDADLPHDYLYRSTRALRACARHAPTHEPITVEAFGARVGPDGRVVGVRAERAAGDALARRRHACVARALGRVAMPRRSPPASLRILIQWEEDTDLDPGPAGL